MLTDAINRQLVSDMPLCFFLSGGLDSSIIVKTASQYYKENKLGKINTYSIEYRDNEKYFKKSLFQPNADFEYISLMSRNADSRHREIILDNKAVADALYDSVIARDLPGYVDVDSSLLLFCGEIKKIIPLRCRVNVLMNFSAVIRGTTTKKFYLKIIFHGQKVRMSAPQY